jgi:hypothetical protein
VVVKNCTHFPSHAVLVASIFFHCQLQ